MISVYKYELMQNINKVIPKFLHRFKSLNKDRLVFVFLLLQAWVFRPSAGFQGKS